MVICYEKVGFFVLSNILFMFRWPKNSNFSADFNWLPVGYFREDNGSFFLWPRCPKEGTREGVDWWRLKASAKDNAAAGLSKTCLAPPQESPPRLQLRVVSGATVGAALGSPASWSFPAAAVRLSVTLVQIARNLYRSPYFQWHCNYCWSFEPFLGSKLIPSKEELLLQSVCICIPSPEWDRSSERN